MHFSQVKSLQQVTKATGPKITHTEHRTVHYLLIVIVLQFE